MLPSEFSLDGAQILLEHEESSRGERLTAGCCDGAGGLNPYCFASKDLDFSRRTLWKWLDLGHQVAFHMDRLLGERISKARGWGLVPLKGAGGETLSLNQMSHASE